MLDSRENRGPNPIPACPIAADASRDYVPDLNWQAANPQSQRSLSEKPEKFLVLANHSSCKCFDKGVDITFVVVRGERDPNASATCTAHNIVTTKSFHNCLYAFASA